MHKHQKKRIREWVILFLLLLAAGWFATRTAMRGRLYAYEVEGSTIIANGGASRATSVTPSFVSPDQILNNPEAYKDQPVMFSDVVSAPLSSEAQRVGRISYLSMDLKDIGTIWISSDKATPFKDVLKGRSYVFIGTVREYFGGYHVFVDALQRVQMAEEVIVPLFETTSHEIDQTERNIATEELALETRLSAEQLERRRQRNALRKAGQTLDEEDSVSSIQVVLAEVQRTLEEMSAENDVPLEGFLMENSTVTQRVLDRILTDAVRQESILTETKDGEDYEVPPLAIMEVVDISPAPAEAWLDTAWQQWTTESGKKATPIKSKRGASTSKKSPKSSEGLQEHVATEGLPVIGAQPQESPKKLVMKIEPSKPDPDVLRAKNKTASEPGDPPQKDILTQSDPAKLVPEEEKNESRMIEVDLEEEPEFLEANLKKMKLEERELILRLALQLANEREAERREKEVEVTRIREAKELARQQMLEEKMARAEEKRQMVRERQLQREVEREADKLLKERRIAERQAELQMQQEIRQQAALEAQNAKLQQAERARLEREVEREVKRIERERQVTE